MWNGMHTAHAGMRYIPNRESYLQFIDYINKYYFQDTVATEECFGFELKYDEETGEYLQNILEYDGDILECPKSFPAIVYYYLDVQPGYGMPDLKIRDMWWESIDKLGIKVFEYEAPVVKKCKWKMPMLAEYAQRKCKFVCDGYCSDCEKYWADGNYMGYTEEEWARYCKFDKDRIGGQ